MAKGVAFRGGDTKETAGRVRLVWVEVNEDDLQGYLQRENSMGKSFLSGFKLALGITAELAPSYSFDDDEEQRACQALQRRRGE